MNKQSKREPKWLTSLKTNRRDERAKDAEQGPEDEYRRTQYGMNRASKLEGMLEQAKAGSATMGPTKQLREISRLADMIVLGEIATQAKAAACRPGCGAFLRRKATEWM